MNIAPATLLDQHDRAREHWSFIDDVEAWCGLPPKLLYAVGSRETNLTNEIGDGGHGFGIWQRDNRSHPGLTPAYLNDVHQQAADAAALLVANLHACGSWRGALAMYNSGRPDDRYTTGHDYAADTLARLSCLITSRVKDTLPDMRPGTRGDAVRFFQSCANTKRFPGTPIAVDGVVGPQTTAMVKAFQHQHGLDEDGIAGRVTLAVMQTCPMPHPGPAKPGDPATRS